MRLGLVAPDCHRRDGQARYVSELAERLGERHEVDVYSASFEETRNARHRPVSAPRRATRLRFFAFGLAATRALRGQRYDLVHALGGSCLGADVLTAQFCQAAWDETLSREVPEQAGGWRDRWLRRAISALEGQAFRRRRVRRVIAVSRRVADELERHYRRSRDVEVIPNGVDSRRFHPGLRDAAPRVRAELGIPADAFLVLFVGEFERKNLKSVIEAMGLLPPTARLLAVGASAAGPYGRLARDHGVEDRVVLSPPTHGPERLMAAADAFAFPTLYEPFGMAPLEAAACATPVLVSRRAGFAEHLRHEAHGYLLDDPRDSQSLASYLRALMQDPVKAEVMGGEARRLAETLDWEQIVARTENLYQELLDQRG